MSDKIAVSQIEIKIGKDVLKLSLAQMQELKDVLNKIFSDVTMVCIDHREPYYIPPPIYINPPPLRPFWRQWETTCGGDSTTTTNTFHIEASQCQD